MEGLNEVNNGNNMDLWSGPPTIGSPREIDLPCLFFHIDCSSSLNPRIQKLKKMKERSPEELQEIDRLTNHLDTVLTNVRREVTNYMQLGDAGTNPRLVNGTEFWRVTRPINLNILRDSLFEIVEEDPQSGFIVSLCIVAGGYHMNHRITSIELIRA